MGVKQWLGLKGSWKWAVRQMKQGRIVYRDTLAGKYVFEIEHGSFYICLETPLNPIMEFNKKRHIVTDLYDYEKMGDWKVHGNS